MKRLIPIFLLPVILAAVAVRAQLPPHPIPLGTSASAGLGGVWDTPGGANCSANFTRSNGNLTVLMTTAAWSSCRATTSHSTGKWFFRLTVQGSVMTRFLAGLENASASTANFPGSTTSTGVGCQGDTTSPLWFSGGGDTLCGPSSGYATSAVVEYAWDITGGKGWSRVLAASTQWDKSASADPATNVGGTTFSISGALFPACGAISLGENEGCTFDPTGGTPPSGFSHW